MLDDLGDQVRLVTADGKVADLVSYGQMAPNASYSLDEVGLWHSDWPPSPGAPNQPSSATPGATLSFRGF